MFSVVALALAATSGGAADEAMAAARRCDTPAYEVAVGRIEDQALEAMKAANEAVARAALSGPVGAAGDAEWNNYKSRMALAEQVRLASQPILAACLAGPGPSRVAQAPTPVVAANPGPAGETAQPLRVRIGISDGAANYHIRSTTSIPVISQSGIYVFNSSSPTGPVSFPGGTFVPSTITQTGSVRLKTDAWENQARASSTFASDGFDRPGWRLSVGLGLDSGTIHQHLAGPLVASAPNVDLAATPQVRGCVVLSAQTGQCFLYALAVPFTGQAFQLGGEFNSAFQSRVNSYDVRQSERQFSVEGGVGRAFALPTPIGPLEVTPGAEFGARWWSFGETRTIDAVAQGQTSDFLFSDHTRGEGPGFSARAKLALSGAVWPSWPLRWTLFGDYGAEWVELNIHNDQGLTAVLNRARPVSGYGGEVEYDFSPAMSLAVVVQQQRIPYVASVLTNGVGPGVTLNDGSGTFLELLDTNATIYSLVVQYGF
ncbi:MAG TPA: hypothetical protein VGI30_08500 [Caulobacteraceae bacterium]